MPGCAGVGAASRLAASATAGVGAMQSSCRVPGQTAAAALVPQRARLRSSGGCSGRPAEACCAASLRARRTRKSHSQVARAASDAGGAQPAGSNGGVESVENVVIIGSGPAGYTAGIYAARASLRPLLFEGVQKGGVPGGQLMTTTEVENFPGFPEGVTGPDLMDRMRKQAERWGTVLATEDVESVDLSVRPFRVRTAEREVRAHSLIVATGATAKRLGLPSEHTFWSRGISACAICDGASPLFKSADVAVVGGGDSAAEEAVYLTKYARHVHLLVRGARMRASAAMAERVMANPRVTVHYQSAPEDVFGDVKGRMAGVRLRDSLSGELRELAVRGLFYAVGHTPNSDLLAGQVELDAAGYVVVRHGAATSVEGVFAAGDLHDTEWRQAITAAGSGCAAAISAERYLVANDLLVQKEQVTVEEAQPQEEAAAVVVEAPVDFNAEATKHAGQFALRKLYHESARPLLVIYTSPTCGPCRRLKPMLTSLVEDAGYASDVHYIEIDIEADPEIAEAAGITGTPTVQVFHRKERVQVMPGVRMKSEYKKVLDGCLGRTVGDAVAV